MDQIALVNSTLLWLGLLFNTLLILALIRRVNHLPNLDSFSARERLLPIGTEAPPFEAVTLSGETLTNAAYTGQELVLVFFSPSCEPCKQQLPSIDSLRSKAEKAGVKLIFVDISSQPEETRTYVNELHLVSPVLTARSNMSSDYQVPGTPSYYLIGRNGKVKSGGFLDESWKTLTKTWERQSSSVSSSLEIIQKEMMP